MVHAIIILTHFHALSSIVFSCGINDDDENDQPPPTNNALQQQNAQQLQCTTDAAIVVGNGTIKPPQQDSPSDLTPPPSPNGETAIAGSATVEALMKKMQSITEQRKEGDEQLTDEDHLIKGFHSIVENTPQTADITAALLLPAAKENTPTPCDPELARFVDDEFAFGYVDFAQRREDRDLSTFRVQDCSWGECAA